jgi:3-oxoacyl-[acyl-carrier protein] reductase
MKKVNKIKEQRVAIVTGGTKNIGLSICKLLLNKDIKVAYVGSSIKTTEFAKNEFLVAGAKEKNFKGFVCDLSNLKNIPVLVEDVISEFGTIDIIINSAGMLDLSSIEKTSVEVWDRVMCINLSAPFFLIQNALPYLKNSNAPRVINIASNAGRMGGYTNGMSYTSSKGGLISLTYGLSRQLAKWDITVNCVAPGTIDSDMLVSRDEDIQKRLLEKFPLGRFGKCNEVAEAVMYFVNKESSFTTGAVLDVNGGMFTG